jgi:competence protein ComEC
MPWGEKAQPPAPLLWPFLAIALGILLSTALAPAAALFLLLAALLSIRRPAKLALLLIAASCGFGRAHCDREAALPGSALRRSLEMELSIGRCTVKEFQTSRRVHGFGKIQKIHRLPGEEFGQSVYYNLNLPPDQPLPKAGQRLHLRAKVHGTAGSAQAFERYLATTGVPYRVDQGRVMAVFRGTTGSEWLANCREVGERALAAGDFPHSNIYRAMLLGNRSSMGAEEKNTYSRTGIAHLFAISGLHIGVIAAFLHFLSKGLTLFPWATFALRSSILLVFVLMTGGSASAFRAFSMAISIWLAPLFFRRSHSLNALALSASIDLLCRPLDILSTSFQFSYGVVFSLLLYGSPLARACRRIPLFRSDPYGEPSFLRAFCRSCFLRICTLLSLSLAATLPLIPLSIYHFQTFSIGGIFLNPLVMPVSAPIIVCGFASICCGFLHLPWLCWLCNAIAAIPLALIHRCAYALNGLTWIESPPLQLGTPFAFLWAALFFQILHRCSRPPHDLRKFLPPLLAAALPVAFLARIPIA